jgi:hypothetical protein
MFVGTTHALNLTEHHNGQSHLGAFQSHVAQRLMACWCVPGAACTSLTFDSVVLVWAVHMLTTKYSVTVTPSYNRHSYTGIAIRRRSLSQSERWE